jgi:hypothetical protein
MASRFATVGLICSLVSSVAAQESAPPASAADAATPAQPVSAGAPVSSPPPAAPVSAPAPPPAASDPTPAPDSERSFFSRLTFLSKVQIHGFVSEGGFVSTANDYIGASSRGSLKLFEAGINFSTELFDDLRVGLQLVSRSVGTLSEEVPRVDWAVADYRWRPWLGIRAGVIKLPFGLYNEYIAIDAARTAILLPQSMYPLRNRDALISHIGFSLYGNQAIGAAGALDYQAWLGTLSIPRSALDLTNAATLDSVDAKYVTGGQLFWRPPLEGLRVGATYLRASMDFHLNLNADAAEQLVMAGLAPAGYQGNLRVSQRPVTFWVVSAEYTHGDLILAAEYSRWKKHQQTSLPGWLPATDEDAEKVYAMASYRLSRHFEIGGYYSVTHANADDRRGRGAQFTKRYQAFQRDLTASLRIDVNAYWLWKLEAHFIDGAADLQATANPSPQRYWGLFLLRTTVTF